MTTATRMDRLILGDNQFFGVNHMSEEKARAQLIKFANDSAILEVIDSAYDAGIKTFMCTTHDRIAAICEHVRSNSHRYPDFAFYPCMPYAHKYANSVTEVGPIETIKRFSSGNILGTLLRGAMGAMTKDIYEMMKLLVDGEMKSFRSLNTPVVFLQNVVTDLLLGLKLHQLFFEFHKYVRDRYDAEAGFITMNTPALLGVLHRVGVQNPIVCSNINKINFRMCGGVDLYEKAIRDEPFRPIAMSVFASGAIPPEEALDYICRQRKIRSIVFGASSRRTIEHTRDLVQKLDAKYASHGSD